MFLAPDICTKVFKHLVGYVINGAVVLVYMTEVRAVLYKEHKQIGVLSDRLPWKSKVRLSNIEDVDVVMAATSVVRFALVLRTQHYIVKD